jgi:hypothetical protein
MTAASDAHHHGAIGTAYTILKTEDFSVQGIWSRFEAERPEHGIYFSEDNLRKT